MQTNNMDRDATQTKTKNIIDFNVRKRKTMNEDLFLVGTWNIRGIKDKEIESSGEFRNAALDILVITDLKAK